MFRSYKWLMHVLYIVILPSSSVSLPPPLSLSNQCIQCIESSRAMNRESARLTTVEKEDPQMVRLMHMDQLFPTRYSPPPPSLFLILSHSRMTTRTTVKVKRTEVFQGVQWSNSLPSSLSILIQDSTYHDSPSNHLQMDKSRLKNLSAIKVFNEK